jgi:diguanylate cyclase (GGDEF)-like protein/putative nucleotidyltransferase with HDIG domain
MKELSPSTKIYLYTTYLAGAAVFAWNITRIDFGSLGPLLFLCVLASLALILKVEGATKRSHYTFSFLVYGFTFVSYGTSETILVIVVSNLVEWIWNKQLWFIQVFNIGCYVLVMQIASLVYYGINPYDLLVSWQAPLAISAGMAVFTLMNHLMVGIVVWFARGEDFKKSGVFDAFPLLLDLALLCFGASIAFVWIYNSFALVLFLVPIYLIYSTLRVPALERQTETDSKTGLFNHAYFKQQMDNELSRADRFDRPMAIIMADLDLLRNINNTYGHLAGDEVLKRIAEILKQSVRDYDVAARFGGEEFAILLPETTIQQAYERAEYIRKVIEETEFTIPTSVSPIRITMSFGIACRERFSQTTDEIIHNADTALYHSKLSGRNRAFAYTNEAYVNFLQANNAASPSRKLIGEYSQDTNHKNAQGVHQSSAGDSSKSRNDDPKTETAREPIPDQTDTATRPRNSKLIVNLYIGIVALAALLSFAVIYRSTIPMQNMISSTEWISLVVISFLVAMSEWFSLNLYFRQTSVSTSAIPILVGYLLFGPIGIFAVSLTVALTLFIKHRSPINRLIFNFSNHILAGVLCSSLILASGRQFVMWDPAGQLLLSLASAGALYLASTWLIAVGMGFDLKQPARQIWKEQYSWLSLYYLGIGIVAFTLVLGYGYDKATGILLMVIPMVFLRLGQTQYISRTREVVIELREKNQILKKNAEEITELNEGLLETLSEIIDLRDPYVLGHSKQVSQYATEIAKIMRLHERQVELIRKGSLLHDIGKLGIPQEILTKPSRLTPEEYEIIKRHAALGAELVEKSPSLRPLIPIIRHHHEFFNGAGYPDRLKGNHISIEARIVAIADAIEAMSSDRPYRKALEPVYVLNELNKHAGSQFDPLVVDAAVKMLEKQNGLKVCDSEIRPKFLPGLTGVQVR